MTLQFQVKIDEESLIQAIDSQLDEIADFIFTKSQETIVRNGIVDEGTLLQSGNINRQFLNKTITYPVQYADRIEFGSMPGEEMISSVHLQGWVRRKLGVTDDKKIKQTAYLIKRKLESQGREPRPFLVPAIQSAKFKFGK